MANFSPALFTRLYAGIIVAFVISIALTQHFFNDFFEQDALNDFVSDTHYIYVGLIDQLQQQPLDKNEYPQANFPFADEFIIDWRKFDNNIPLCELCEYIGDADGIKVYQLENDRLLAVYWIPQLNSQLLISDLENPIVGIDNDPVTFTGLTNFSVEVDIEVAIFSLFALTSLIIIGGFIYWPVRKLKKQILSLVETNHAFGRGELQARADENLTKPLNELASSFNLMASSINDSVKENQIFAQAVPHEVRTPLSRIQLAAGLLRRSCKNEQELALIENIDTYIDDIDELIGQIVAFTRLSAITEDDNFDAYQTIELRSFTQSRIKAVNTGNEDKHLLILLNIDEKISITTNPMYLRLLIDNLVKNALNHALSSISISVKNRDNNIMLTVEDDGTGIPSESFETIFFPFARLDKSRSRKTGGLGLGLAIAKATSKKMQASLEVSNNESGGAKFTCTFFAN
jgi:signal transduction histidine kinase